jgi:4-azaleucine resistance transporter AzlC
MRDGARAALPLAVAVGIFGISFGLLAREAGFSALASLLMSATTFGGSAQFAAISVIRDGGGAAAAATAAILLNARYGPIGLTIAPSLRGRALVRFLQSQLAVDESWAIANRGEGRFDRDALIGAGIVIYAAWLAGTAIGVAGGEFLANPETLGLDAAFPALFLALLLGQLRKPGLIVAALLGGGIAVALIPFTQPGIPIVAASLAALAGWRRR